MNDIVDIFKEDIKQLYKYNFDIDNIGQYTINKLFFTVNGIKNEEIINQNNKDSADILLTIKGSSELHYAYLSVVCDYIAQMTDDYALKEYNELYSI